MNPNIPDNLGKEWDAQEEARREEQRSADGEPSEALVQQYRLIARAARSVPLDPLPHNFAEQTAMRVERLTAARSKFEDERFEATLQIALVVLLIVAGAASIMFFGGQWLAAWKLSSREWITANSPSGAWIFTSALCLAVPTAFELLRANRDR